MTERLHFHFHFSLSCIGEGNGNPLQCSCLENPRVGGAWWAAVYGVAQSRTRLKGLSSSMCKIFDRCVVKYLYMNIRHQKQNHKARCLSPEGEIQVCVCVCLCGTHICMCPFSHVQLSVTPWTVTHQAPLSMGFSRQEYWSELPFPSPGDLSDPGIKPPSLTSPALAGRFFTTSTTWEAWNSCGMKN